MLDVSTLTIALHGILDAAAGLSAATVERGTRINFDPARALDGWIGVYPGQVDTVPQAMAGKQWQDNVMLQVVVQTASFRDDGQAASDLLEDLLQKVLDAINATNLTLGITGVRITGFSREYRYVVFDDDGEGDIFMPQAIIKFNLTCRSN